MIDIIQGLFQNNNSKFILYLVVIVSLVGCARERGGRFTLEEFYADGSTVKNKIEYLNDSTMDGSAIYYYENGQIASEGFFKNNKRHGIYTEYYIDGTIKETGKYTNGKTRGNFYYYYSNGTLEIYNAKHYGNDVFYVVKFDSLGNKIKEEGLVICRTVAAYPLKEKYAVGDDIELNYSIAEPPGYIPEVFIGLYKNSDNGKRDIIDTFRQYPVVEGLVNYNYTFSSSGYYSFECRGKLTDSLGNLIMENTAYTDIIVE